MKKIIFVLEEASLFVSASLDKDSVGEARFFDSISYILLPVLRMCNSLIKDRVSFKLAFSISPIYCDMLSSPILLKRYKESLEKKLDFVSYEKLRIKYSEKMLKVLEERVKFIENSLSDFIAMKADILSSLKKLEEDGFVELVGTTVSNIFLPLYKEKPEVVYAQIGMGRLAYANYFPNSKITGFYPPFLGAYEGIDKTFHALGYEYSLVAGSSFLLSKKLPKTGIFAPSITENAFKLLATDTNTYYDLVFSDDAYQKNDVYINNKSDIGFSLEDRNYLSPLFNIEDGRRLTGFRYYNKKNEIYDYEKAWEQAKKDAASFVEERTRILEEVEECTALKKPFSLMLMPSNLLGFKWQEGFVWLEEVFRKIDSLDGIELALPRDMIKGEKNFELVEPFYSSLLDSNYAEELFTDENDWVYRYVMKATDRLIGLINSFEAPSSFNVRTLNQATRELTLMQDAYWSILLNDKCYKKHAKKHFKSLVKNFTYIWETLGANKEETRCLIRREAELDILKYADYTLYKR